jgi:L-aminopeptidase/D-esterase
VGQLYRFAIGDYKTRPNKDMGYKACVNANNREVQDGNVGAGTGATIGKILGPEYAMKGGLGIYSVKVGELMIGAVVAVNCLGNVVDSENGKVIGGVLEEERTSFRSTEDIMISQYNNKKKIFNGNTTIGAVVTNAKLSKSEANKVAAMAHNGFARSIYPVHTMHDGDTIFTMATGKIEADINVVGLMAAKVIEKAVVRGIKNSYEIGGYKCYKDLQKV